MSKKQDKLPELFWDNLSYLQHDVGFQSRFRVMSEDYMPLVERVEKLEQVLEALLYHLDLEALYKVTTTIIREHESPQGNNVEGQLK